MALFGFTSIKDMFDGGGKGGSGANFSTKSHSEYKKENPKDTTVKAHTSKSSSNKSSGSSKSSTPTFKSLSEAAEAGYHGQTVNIAGKGKQKVSFADKNYDKKMAAASNAASSGGLKSLGTAIKNAPKNIVQDIGMGVGLTDRDADYYRRTADTIARTQGKDAADRYISQMTAKGGDAAAGVAMADVDGSVSYGQRIGMLNQDGSVNKNYMGNNDGGGSNVITPAAEDIQSPQDQFRNNQAMLDRMRMLQQQQYTQGRNMDMARRMFESQNMMSPGFMPRQMQGLGGFMQQPFRPQVNPYTQAGQRPSMYPGQNTQPQRPQVNPYTQAGQRPSMYPGQTVQPMQTPQQTGGKGAQRVDQLNRLLGGNISSPSMYDIQNARMRPQPATPIQPQGPIESSIPTQSQQPQPPNVARPNAQQLLSDMGMEFGPQGLRYVPKGRDGDINEFYKKPKYTPEQENAYAVLNKYFEDNRMEVQPISPDQAVSTAQRLGLMTQGPQVNPYTQAGQRSQVHPYVQAGLMSEGYAQRIGLMPEKPQVMMTNEPQGPQVNPYTQAGQRPSMYPGQNAQPSMFNPYQQQPFNRYQAQTLLDQQQPFSRYQQPMSGKGGGQTMRQSRFGSPAFNYASQNYDRLGGMQRTMPRPMEMMSNAERQQIGRIADSFQPQPMSGKGGGQTMRQPMSGKGGGQTMRQPMSGKGGGVTKPQYGGFLGGYF